MSPYSTQNKIKLQNTSISETELGSGALLQTIKNNKTNNMYIVPSVSGLANILPHQHLERVVDLGLLVHRLGLGLGTGLGLGLGWGRGC